MNATQQPLAIEGSSEADVAQELNAPNDEQDGGQDAKPQGSSRVRASLRRVVPRTRKVRVFFLTAIVLAISAAGGVVVWRQGQQLPSNVALKVGNRSVTVTELTAQASRLQALYGVTQPTDAAKQVDYWKAMAQAEAMRLILDRETLKEGVVVADKAAEDAMSRFITQQYGDGPDGRTKFITAIGAAGTSETAVVDEIKHMLAVNQLFGKVTANVAVSDAELRAAFEQRKNDLGTPAQRRILNIVVGSSGEASDVVKRLKSGASFQSVARDVSLDDASRDSGGDLGELAAAQLDPGYAKVAFAAPLNTVFGPVQTQYGWNVGMAVKAVAAVPANFDAVKAVLKQTLMTEKALKIWQDWLVNELKNGHVKYASKYRPANPNVLPSVPGVTGATGSPSSGASVPALGK